MGIFEFAEKIGDILEAKGKSFWLREWDCNTQFFHKFASGRRKSNGIHHIKDVAGVWKEITQEVQYVIDEYFSQLFTSSSIDGKLSNREHVTQVSKRENEELIIRPFIRF